MPIFEVYLEDRLFWRYKFDQEQILIGRSEDNDIVLKDSVVSRLHATVQKKENQYLIIDKSTNGTFVNKNRIDKQIVLADRDRIKIGDYFLVYRVDPPVQKAPQATKQHDTSTMIVSYNQQTGSLSFEKYFLQLSTGDPSPKQFLINKACMKIGSDPDNDICLKDSSVSKHHAAVEHRQEKFYLKDLNSAKGTFIGDNQISETALNPGDEIRLGTAKLRFVSSTEGDTISPSEESDFCGMVGESHEMRKIYSLLQRIAPSNVPILLQGETGTGKELAARAIHSLSECADGPLIIINCGAIPGNLIESEFFGHKKGAFTGSQNERIGAFERADGGTIFLDEIGELPIDLQPRLLRVIEEKAVTRVGGNEAHPTNFRLVTATNRKLEEEIEKGTFRQDLFFRINVVPINLPPLRERKEDIPALAEHFLKSKTDRAKPLKLSNEAKKKLMRHDWPGNVREIKNVIERAALMAEHNEIQAEDLIFIPIGKEEVDGDLVKGNLSLEEMEKKVILNTLKAQNGDKKATAEILGVAYSTLWAKLKKYNIQTDDTEI